MADPQRDAFLRKMIAEGTSDDDILATLKVYDAKRALPTKPVSAEDFIPQDKPLLTGLTDAGAARQFTDPSAMTDLNAAKDRMANVGALTAMSALGGATAAATNPGIIKGTAQALLAGGAYGAGRSAGIPAPIMDAALIAFGLRRGVGGGRGGAPEEALPDNTGGRLVTTKVPSAEQQFADTLAELRNERPTPDRVSLPPQPSLPPGYTPRSTYPAVPSTPTAAPTSTAPAQAPSSSLIPQLSDLKPTVREIPPGDMPRSWHAFMDDASRAAANPDELRQATALHKELAQMDAAYRGKTAAERLAMQQAPQSYRDAILSFLTKQ